MKPYRICPWLAAGAVLGFMVWQTLAMRHVIAPIWNSVRVDDYPNTYISQIAVDVTNPSQVRLTWTGPSADRQDHGPFRASVGRGCGTNNCDDPVESNCLNSQCTPKGTRVVEMVMDNLKNHPACRFATVIDRKRAIALHSHHEVPNYPSSSGCIRLESYAAKLIHDNCIVNKTLVNVHGKWSLPDQRTNELSLLDTQ